MAINTVLTVYLTQRDDPQPNRGRWKTDENQIVETWICSLELLGLHGIIFHDGLSHEFAEKWGNHVRFVPVTWQTPWTAAEERVRIYLDWLSLNQYDWVLTTDLSDVEFYRDPFEVMTDPTKLYIGSEPEMIGGSWIERWMKAAYGRADFTDRQILNPGIVGGSQTVMLEFVKRWLVEMGRAVQPTPPPHDIAAFNRLIYRENIPFVTGQPLHTVFKKFEGPESGAAIRHK